MTYILLTIIIILIVINAITSVILLNEYNIENLDTDPPMIKKVVIINMNLIPLIATAFGIYKIYGFNTTIEMDEVIVTGVILFFIYMIEIVVYLTTNSD